jgi:hypothetical protein
MEGNKLNYNTPFKKIFTACGLFTHGKCLRETEMAKIYILVQIEYNVWFPE